MVDLMPALEVIKAVKCVALCSPCGYKVQRDAMQQLLCVSLL